jgi:hypothetical protein
VLADDVDEPRRPGHGPPPGRRLRVRLERGDPADLDDGSDDEEARARQVEGIGPEADRLAPSQPCAGGGRDDRSVAGWDGREQSGPEIASTDDSLVAVPAS